MTRQDDVGRTFQTSAGACYVGLGPSFAIAGGPQAFLVSTDAGQAVLVELPEALPSESLAARERALAREAHVLAAREIGLLVSAEARGAMPYRGSAYGVAQRSYALFPALAVRSLASWLARARAGEMFAPGLVIALALECARGMDAMDTHELLTPGSILIGADGTTRIRGPVLEALVAHASASEAPRWLGYRAPELLRAGSVPTPAASLFALGVMLLELVSGRALFPASGPGAAQRIARWRVSRTDLEGLGADVPHALRALVWSLLQRDPDRRASPRMIVDELTGLYEPDPGAAATFAHGASLTQMFALY